MGSHHPIIMAKEIGEFTLYLTGPKTIDALNNRDDAMDLVQLRDGFETLAQMFDHRADEIAKYLYPGCKLDDFIK